MSDTETESRVVYLLTAVNWMLTIADKGVYGHSRVTRVSVFLLNFNL